MRALLTTERAALNPGRRRAICGADMDSPGADIPAQRGPLPAFRALVAAGELAPDPSQELVAERLQALWERLRGYDPPPRPANGTACSPACCAASRSRSRRTASTSWARSGAASPC